MGKHDASPTLMWSWTSRAWRKVGILLSLLLLAVVIWAFRVQAVVDHNCDSYYVVNVRPFGLYWVHGEIGSTKDGCPDPWKGLR